MLTGTVLWGYASHVQDAVKAALPAIAAGRMQPLCMTFERVHQFWVSRALQALTAMRVFHWGVELQINALNRQFKLVGDQHALK